MTPIVDSEKQIRKIEARTESSNPWSVKARSALFAFLGIAVAGISLLVLSHLSSDIYLHDVRQSLREIPRNLVFLAFAFTILSFAAVAIYDVVAVETIAP